MSSGCAPKVSPSRKARARCRPPSAPPGPTVRRPDDRRLRRVRRRSRPLARRRCPIASRARGPASYAAGHTDPHSALGIGALAGFLAAKHAMEQHGITGTLRFLGEPAEKMCGSKPVHAAQGYYDGLDAAISFHPHSFHGAQQRLFLGHAMLRPTGAASTPSNATIRRPGRASRLPATVAHGACRRARARRDRRGLPDVHLVQVHQGGDAAASPEAGASTSSS